MGVLLIVLLIIVALSWRAGLYRSEASVADSDSSRDVDCGFFDVCARTFVLVFLCLLGLLALGMMYGNVLGAVQANP
ncbi:MAG TPA: hypothetical protein VJT78_13350 [Candidatus Dormibacteraeota bacterium]|nr:hypothetical protein [Candidatus Dormibacteraeota bacterium]